MNKTALLALSAVLIFSGAGNASAAFWAVNGTTGFGSTNTVSATGMDLFTQVNTNTETIGNSQSATTDTGNNESDDNTGSGDVESGMIDVMGGFVNETNLNVSVQTNVWWTELVGAENDTTGSGSTNDATATFDSTGTVVNDNDATLGNDIVVDANTGDNSTNDNTGDGDVESGDADGVTEIINDANANLVDVSVGSGDSSVVAGSDTTGSGSTNTSSADLDNDVTLVSTNGAEFDNTADIDANTGDNSSNANTGDGSVESGIASGSVLIDNGSLLNSNTTSLSFGSGMFDILSMNMTTGSGSTNDSSATVANDATVVNDNEAIITNTADVILDSGNNEADDNTGSGDVESGTVVGEVEVVNNLNINSTGIDWMSMGDVVTGNDTTGSGSTNTSSADVTNSVTVVNDNSSELTTTSIIDANSGDNSSNDNTGDGDVESGSSSVMFGVTNTGNGNFTLIQ